ncbi:probable LRR receptor-like serine/threonine-protein kinase At1g51880 [Gossypium hirsutum]|uniref:non-specific serine/threonine protein kinase n=1 Tax=Gossypium hirsutum TaxID=3635 RepID=A0ABM2YV92_GOSHI|nr:probable LRR receptor-like serine/threonine-protein kinase At1g51880 [Gossypium hirsutum]
MLHNLLLLFVFVITCFRYLILATATATAGVINNNDLQRRKLATDENPGFVSIDCGVEDDYFDNSTGIRFKSDTEFISSGENHDTFPEYFLNNEQFGKRYETVRSFPNGMKNCYTLKLEQATNNSFRIRASFAYGNYDRKNKIPKFDLYLGVNYWTTVNLTNFEGFFYEIIHVFPADTEYVCLANTGTGTPFISALEIRPSNISTYGNGSSLELINIGLYDLSSYPGQSPGVRMSVLYGRQSLSWNRYKDDIYDRVWYPSQLPRSVPINTSSDIDTQGSGNLYKLPVEVLRTAVRPFNGSNSLSYSSSFASSYDYNLYFHFAELEFFEDKQREISITVNGITQGPFTLEYLKPLSISFQRLRTVEGNITFTISTTMESGLPPILNALEYYQLKQFTDSATDPSDVNAIMSIKHTYNRDDWQGDPCLPKGYSWSGLSCHFGSPPRIISLNLSSSKLTGEISPSLAHLLELQSIDLSYNDLTGSVPDVLATLPKLKSLNISGNKLKGPIPQSLKDKSDHGSLLLSFDENQTSCHRDPCEGNSKKFIVPVVVSIIAAVALVILLSVLFIFHRKRKRKQTEVVNNTTASNKEEFLKSKNQPFTYSEIVTITANFKTGIGEGGFGKVFHGHLNDGTPVAVKLLSSSSKQGYKEFQAEAQSLMIVHHKNLVSLIGYCKEDDHMALVYEFIVGYGSHYVGNPYFMIKVAREHILCYCACHNFYRSYKERKNTGCAFALFRLFGFFPTFMSNGNLRQHLFSTKTTVLNWNQRLQIAVDAAQGLDYLHNGCKPPIVHRDLKPSNILLTENMQAKIADFGLSRAFSMDTSTSSISTALAGTPGYIDPELHASGTLNKKSDVYSFGIILFELITVLPVQITNTEHIMHIVDWVTPMIEEGDIRKIIDPRLGSGFDVNAAWKAVEIAMWCAQRTSKQRPDISQVIAELKECIGRNDQNVQIEMTSLEMASYSYTLPRAR